MITFNGIAGVPVNYDRDSTTTYGTRGAPVNKGGPVTPEFYAALDRWIGLLSAGPWGKPELLVTGGIRGAGTDPANRHTQGRAIDIDGLWWAGKPPLIALRAPQTPVLYLAVEATLRSCFGTVLDYWYNDAHRDHWHADDGHAVGWHESRAHVVFLQAALDYVWTITPQLAIDGTLGPKTRAAFVAVMGDPDIGAAWGHFLQATADRGLRIACG